MCLCVSTLDAVYFKVAGGRRHQATKPVNAVAKSLNLGRDDLYVVTDVQQLRYELEV